MPPCSVDPVVASLFTTCHLPTRVNAVIPALLMAAARDALLDYSLHPVLPFFTCDTAPVAHALPREHRLMNRYLPATRWCVNVPCYLPFNVPTFVSPEFVFWWRRFLTLLNLFVTPYIPYLLRRYRALRVLVVNYALRRASPVLSRAPLSNASSSRTLLRAERALRAPLSTCTSWFRHTLRCRWFALDRTHGAALVTAY